MFWTSAYFCKRNIAIQLNMERRLAATTRHSLHAKHTWLLELLFWSTPDYCVHTQCTWYFDTHFTLLFFTFISLQTKKHLHRRRRTARRLDSFYIIMLNESPRFWLNQSDLNANYTWWLSSRILA